MPSPKVLIIDDEPILRQTMKKALRDQGYDLYFAENGREGLALLDQESPDLIFLDLRMPEMDGFTFLELVNHKSTDPYSVVVITGHGGDDDIRKSYGLGVHSFIRKPLNLVEVCSLAERCIKFKEIQNEREGLIKELREAMDAIKTLQDFLPICAACKKIRDENDHWHEIDTYIREHTDTKFSHSVCPDCVKKLYPEFYEKLKKKI